MRRPGPVALVTAAVMLAAALPALGTVWTPATDSSVIPQGQSARTVADALTRDFAGAGRSPVTVAISAPESGGSAVSAYAHRVAALPGVTGITATRYLGARHLAARRRRQRGLGRRRRPAASSGTRAGLEAPFPTRVTGDAAAFVDQQAAIGSHLPLAIGLLAILTFLVLWLMTDSVVLPLKAIVMNALTVGASLAPLMLIYQHGRLTGLLGYTPNGGVEPTDFVVAATVVFALSTDYGVFLLGRIKEARDGDPSRVPDEREAVAAGLGATGRVVTAAAILLAVAIGAFSTSSISFIQQIGVATATGVLIDAFVVRSLLVPSLMALLGALELVVAAGPARPPRPHRPGRAGRTGPRPARGRSSRSPPERPYDRRYRGPARRQLPAPDRLAAGAGRCRRCSCSTPRSRSGGSRSTSSTSSRRIAGCLPLVLRRRLSFPRMAPLLVGGVVLVLWLLHPENTVVLIPMVALFELALGGDRRRSLWMGLAVVPCVFVSVVPFASGWPHIASIVVRNLALCLLAIAAGDVLRTRRLATAQLVRTREQETLRRVVGRAAADRPRDPRRRRPRDDRDQRPGRGGGAPARARSGPGPRRAARHQARQRRGARRTAPDPRRPARSRAGGAPRSGRQPARPRVADRRAALGGRGGRRSRSSRWPSFPPPFTAPATGSSRRR